MKITNKKGFTLIEVVLVLAIGGLIFLLAFLAFQNASVDRRDQQRRQDAGKVIAEMANAQSDGFKVTDSNLATFRDTYLGDFYIPNSNTEKYTLNTKTAGTAVTSKTTKEMYVGLGQKCDGNANTTTSSSNTAVVVVLEKGWACRDDE